MTPASSTTVSYQTEHTTAKILASGTPPCLCL